MSISRTSSSRRTYNADEAFALLGMARSTGFDLIKRGQFPAPVIRAGRRIYIPRDPLDRLLGGGQDHPVPERDPARGTGSSDQAPASGNGGRYDRLAE
jgi:hypothetical protein